MKIIKWIDKNLEKYVMLLLLMAMVAVMGVQIFCRFVLNYSLSWSEELTRFMFIWMAFLSIAFCMKENISLRIDTLITVFPQKVQALLLLVSQVVMLAFFVYMLPGSWNFAYASIQNGQTSAACGIPMYMVQISLMIGFALAAIRCIQGIVRGARVLAVKGEK